MSGRDRDRERDRRAVAASARTNEYFVPKAGIDREVITADICRYLGNDALVRPGNYEVSRCRRISVVIIVAEANYGTRTPRLDKSKQATSSLHTGTSQP